MKTLEILNKDSAIVRVDSYESKSLFKNKNHQTAIVLMPGYVERDSNKLNRLHRLVGNFNGIETMKADFYSYLPSRDGFYLGAILDDTYSENKPKDFSELHAALADIYEIVLVEGLA